MGVRGLQRHQRPRHWRLAAGVVGAWAALGVGCVHLGLREVALPRPAVPGACLVIGFLGGRDRWDDPAKRVRQVALRLRQPGRLEAETFANRRRDLALEAIVRALGADGDGRIDPGEARRVTLVLYGQSLGGAAVLHLARQLQRRGIAVHLTVQVDSVGRGDAVVPANVRYAANLYQDDGWLIEGEHPIRAADPGRTRILGNFRFRYDRPPGSAIEVGDLPWWKLLFRVAHARMERDPRVWVAVEELIRGACRGDDLAAIARRLGLTG